jgi:hypothetical protein
MKSQLDTFRSARGIVRLSILSLAFSPLPLAILAHPLLAQSPGTFTAAGNLTTNRTLPTATLLPNGRVLIVGDGDGLQNDGAELYDPVARTFRTTGNTAAWSAQSATLLPNGRVLIAGGYSTAGTPSARAELYDPATETFSVTGPMTKPRIGQRAVLLANGKVLLVGGEAAKPPFPNDITAEVYDPATNAFAATGSLIGAGPLVSYATLLADGRVLVVGEYSGLAGLYDPAAGIFSPTGNANLPHSSATLLSSGKVLFSGGTDDIGWDSRAELYDPANGTFSFTGSMIGQRADQSDSLLPDGSVLIAGGDPDPSTGSAELYDPVTGTFTATGNMIKARLGAAATLLPDGTVLIAGGIGFGGFSPGTLAEIYHPLNPKPAPVLLSLSDGHAAIQHAGTYQLVSADNPAVTGEALIIYCTGLSDGSMIAPQVSIDGRMAEVLWFGYSPGYLGLNQVNILVPTGIAPSATVTVWLTYLSRPSNEVTIAVR